MRFQPLDQDLQGVVTLAYAIWEKYHTKPAWFAHLLELLQISLDQHATALGDVASMRSKLTVFANLIDSLMNASSSMRTTINQWCTELLKMPKMTVTECRRWRFNLVIILSARGCVSVLHILEHICLPLLADNAASVSSELVYTSCAR
jgi:hypothetical protein